MKIIKCLFCAVFVVCLCCGCGLLTEEYVCNVDAVKSVYIVQLDQHIEDEYRFDCAVLCEVNDTTKFVDRLNSLDQHINWGDPRTLCAGYVVVRIEYENGDYDLIHPEATIQYYSNRNHNAFVFFDTEQFENLISDYVK